MSCDTCGKSTTDLVALRDDYQTREIKSVCRGCEKVINDKLLSIRLVTATINESLIRRFMENLRSKIK